MQVWHPHHPRLLISRIFSPIVVIAIVIVIAVVVIHIAVCNTLLSGGVSTPISGSVVGLALNSFRMGENQTSNLPQFVPQKTGMAKCGGEEL